MLVLIVEDSAEHMAEAQKALTDAGIEFIACNNARSAEFRLTEHEMAESYPHEYKKIDGIITDIFLPYPPHDGVIHPDEFVPDGEATQPCGLGVGLRAEQLGIPFVFCTSGYHHAENFDWIHKICNSRNSLGWVEMVDIPRGGGPSKDWAKAISKLKYLIERSTGAS